jgi:hypothetical protein
LSVDLDHPVTFGFALNDADAPTQHQERLADTLPGPVQNLAFAGGSRTQKQHYETKITLARLAGFVEGGLNLPEPLGDRRCALGGVSVPDKIENACGLNHPSPTRKLATTSGSTEWW